MPAKPKPSTIAGRFTELRLKISVYRDTRTPEHSRQLALEIAETLREIEAIIVHANLSTDDIRSTRRGARIVLKELLSKFRGWS